MYYIFYFKDDAKCEPINRTLAISIDEAIKKFAKIKNLSIDSFNKLFIVKST